MIRKVCTFPPVAFWLEVSEQYSRINVARGAASLAYFFILTLFPILMCANYLIGLLSFDPDKVFFALESVLPQEVVTIILDYLGYVSSNQSDTLLMACLFTIVLSASSGLRSLLHTMDELYDRPPQGGWKRTLMSIFLSLLFLSTIYLSIVVIFTGDWFFQALENWLPERLLEVVPISAFSSLWRGLRYLVLFLFVLILVLAVYQTGIPASFRMGKGTIRLTATISAGAMVASSILFSWFIDMSSRYALVYGSLASLIILLVWLYFCGNILLLGAVIGRVWVERHRKETPEEVRNP